MFITHYIYFMRTFITFNGKKYRRLKFPKTLRTSLHSGEISTTRVSKLRTVHFGFRTRNTRGCRTGLDFRGCCRRHDAKSITRANGAKLSQLFRFSLFLVFTTANPPPPPVESRPSPPDNYRVKKK